MKANKLIFGFPELAGFVGIVLGAVLLAFSGTVLAQFEDYSDPETCGRAGCHNAQWQDWSVSGHPYKLMKGEEARNRPIPLPEGYAWDEISYVIGGYKWKSRYMDTDGYIITQDKSDQGGRTQYNYLTDNWVNYNADKENGVKPYDCGRCHTTGWIENPDPTDLTGNQDGLPGIHGQFYAGGIQCQECHGTSHPGNIPAMTDDGGCAGCHIRGEADTIPASGGFVRHHEQYNEHLAGPHAVLDCTSCHNPHKRGEWSITTTCEDCHGGVAESYAMTSMYDYGVECVDCHMPFASKSAEALGPVVDGNQTMGDVMTHIFYIDTDPDGNMFTAEGDFVDLDENGKAAVTMNFACQRCHETASLDELSLFAMNFHGADGSLQKFGLDPGLTGTWWNSDKSGEGFLLEVDENRFLYASFYTYGPDGSQTWLVAALDTSAGTTANVKVYKPEGGTWGDPSGADTSVEWGIGTFSFPTCTSATFLITPNQTMQNMGYTALTYDLTRILPSGTACPTFTNNEMAAMQ